MANELTFDKVYPWIKQLEGSMDGDEITFTANDGTTAKAQVPWHLWMADLGVFYVIDDGDRFQMLQSNMLPEGVTEDQLFEKACNNLLRDVEYRVAETNWGGNGLVCGGNFEACAICIPGIAEFLGQQYQEDFIMAVPARDVILMVPAGDDARVHNLKVTVKSIMEGGDHTLSKHLFRYSIETHEFSDIGAAY